ncbi:hypothetical protein BKA63DRAFT_425007 [Paraphoma chrysanthemicola]|nr:hypothetical protein BKA63DRAFT_425007 [Paraphoma chrysanthemicola]
MVYERLPVETRHLPFGTPGERRPLDLVWSTIPGVTILRACRRIYAEAAPILEPRLSSLRDAPLRLISSTFGIDNIHLHLLAEYAVGWGQQPDREIFEDPYPSVDSPHPRYTPTTCLLSTLQLIFHSPTTLTPLRASALHLRQALPPAGLDNMLDQQPFRFLDLPKEIRLMVYERLPTKITHHSTAFQRVVLPKQPVLICSKITGSNILSTCVQINNEAGAVLGPRLASMQESPVRIIVDTHILADGCCAAILRYLFASEQDCSHVGDLVPTIALRNAWLKAHNPHKHVSPQSRIQRVDIALRYVNNCNLDSGPTLRDLEFGFEFFCADVRGMRGDGYETAVSIRIRPAVLPPHAQAIFERGLSFKGSPFMCVSSPSLTQGTFRIGSGEDIEEEEWQKDWVEGERFE